MSDDAIPDISNPVRRRMEAGELALGLIVRLARSGDIARIARATTVVRHILCLYECTALILLWRRRSPTLSTAVRANAMRHKATVFEQIVQHFPWHRFEHHVRQHGADDDQRGFT